MSGRLWWATLCSSSPRYQDWLAILGTADVPLVRPADFESTLGEGGTAFTTRVYLLNIADLRREQFDRLVTHIAAKFKAPEAEVRDEILRSGFPIRSEDVTVSFSLRAFI